MEHIIRSFLEQYFPDASQEECESRLAIAFDMLRISLLKQGGYKNV